jgi:hypothetical protein
VRRLVLVSALVAALAAAPVAAAVTAFVTPKRGAYCKVDTGAAKLVCWRPSNGFTARMTATGKVSAGIESANRGRFDSAPGRVLGLGKTWTRGAWACTNRKTGLICLNRKSHGWFFGKVRGYRKF